jgi:hypothetical protein
MAAVYHCDQLVSEVSDSFISRSTSIMIYSGLHSFAYGSAESIGCGQVESKNQPFRAIIEG